MSDIEFRLVELERRLANVLRIGTVEQLDEAAARVRIRIGELLTDWLPWFTSRAGPDVDWWAPEVGEQVMVFSPSGELGQGVVQPAIYQTAHPAPAASKDKRRIQFQDGTVIEYDRAAHKLLADVKGDVELIATGTLVANIAGSATLTTPQTTINGDVQINGEVTTSGNITAGQNVSDQAGAKSMAGMRGTFNSHTHPETGDGGGTTQQPNQAQ